MEPLGDEQALAAAFSLVDDALGALGDVAGSLSLFSPLSSPLGAPQWVDAPHFDFCALEDAENAALPAQIEPQTSGKAVKRGNGKQQPPVKKATTKRPYNYNSNRARDEQRRELRALRAEAAGLESKLATLRKLGALRGVDVEGGEAGKNGKNGAQDPLAEVVWKNIAQHQFRKRLASSLKHDELEAAVRANQSAIQRMKDLLRSQSLQKVRSFLFFMKESVMSMLISVVCLLLAGSEVACGREELQAVGARRV